MRFACAIALLSGCASTTCTLLACSPSQKQWAIHECARKSSSIVKYMRDESVFGSRYTRALAFQCLSAGNCTTAVETACR